MPVAGAPARPPGRPSPFVVDVDEATFGSLLQASATGTGGGRPVGELGRAGQTALSPILEKLATAAGRLVDPRQGRRRRQPADRPGVRCASRLPMVVALASGQPVNEPLTAAVAGSRRCGSGSPRCWTRFAITCPASGQAEARAGRTQPAGPSREPEPEDPRFVAAEEALAAGDYAAAERGLSADPGRGTGQRRRPRRRWRRPALLSRVETAPARRDREGRRRHLTMSWPQRDAADLQLANGDVDGAFDRLIGTVRRTSDEDRTTAREHLVELFRSVPAGRRAGGQGAPGAGGRTVLSRPGVRQAQRVR